MSEFKHVYPRDDTLFSCYNQFGTWYCTYSDFRNVYFKWRQKSNQPEKCIRISKNDKWKRWRLAWYLGSFPEMRDGSPPYTPDGEWQDLIDSGNCYVS